MSRYEAPDVQAAPTPPPTARPAGDLLPPVEAPTGRFILQLFLIPLLIVSIVVLLWLTFSWLAHMGGDDPQDLVKGLARGDDSSWQGAHRLAELLRNPDPKYDQLRADSKLARQLADLLERDLAHAAQGDGDQLLVTRRVAVGRAVGSVTVTDGVPVLMQAAKEGRDPIDVQVGLAAREATTELAHN